MFSRNIEKLQNESFFFISLEISFKSWVTFFLSLIVGQRINNHVDFYSDTFRKKPTFVFLYFFKFQFRKLILHIGGVMNITQ